MNIKISLIANMIWTTFGILIIVTGLNILKIAFFYSVCIISTLIMDLDFYIYIALSGGKPFRFPTINKLLKSWREMSVTQSTAFLFTHILILLSLNAISLFFFTEFFPIVFISTFIHFLFDLDPLLGKILGK